MLLTPTKLRKGGGELKDISFAFASLIIFFCFLIFNQAHVKNAQIQNRLLQIGLKKDNRACLMCNKRNSFSSHTFHSTGNVTGFVIYSFKDRTRSLNTRLSFLINQKLTHVVCCHTQIRNLTHILHLPLSKENHRYLKFKHYNNNGNHAKIRPIVLTSFD